MALPDSVNTVYAPGSQVKSADLNDIQKMLVQGAYKEEQVWQTITALDFVDPAAKGYTMWSPGNGYGIEITQMNVLYTEPCVVDLEPGDVITALHVHTGAAVSGAAQNLQLWGPGGTGGLNGGAALVANTTYTVDLTGAPYTVPAGWFLSRFALIAAVGVAGNIGNSFVGFGLTKHRPLV